jgi:homospermidine synthase
MKLKVFEKADSKNKSKLVRLIQTGDEAVLCNVDEDGDATNIIATLTEQGTLFIHSDIEEDSGFELDEFGQIKVERAFYSCECQLSEDELEEVKAALKH